MSISQYSIMDETTLSQCTLSNRESANSIDEELFSELCKRLMISNNILELTLRRGFELTLALDVLATVHQLQMFFSNITRGDDEYFDAHWIETASINLRLNHLLSSSSYGSKAQIKAAVQLYYEKLDREVKELAKRKLAEDGLYDCLIERLNINGFVRLPKITLAAYEYVLSQNAESTVSDLAQFICAELLPEAVLKLGDNGEISVREDCLETLKPRFAIFMDDSTLDECTQSESDNAEQSELVSSYSFEVPSYIINAVRGRCFFDITDDDVSVDGDEISYCPSIAPSYVRALMLSDTDVIDMERIIEMAEDVNRHASVRWEVSIKGATKDYELIGTFLFDAQLILLVPNTCEDIDRVVEALKRSDMPRFSRGGGVVLGAYDNEKETVRFMLSDGTLPALNRTSQELLDTVPAAIIPPLYQLSFLPIIIDEGADNEQVVQDIIHRLMLEYNQVKYSDSFLDTFLDVQGFSQSIGTLISSQSARIDKSKKRAYKSFFDKWLDDCEYTLPQLLDDIRNYGAKRDNGEAERLVDSIDAMRNDMNISSNEIRCLSYNSVERLSAMGIDERMLDVMEHKLDTLFGIISEMRVAVEDTRKKIQ